MSITRIPFGLTKNGPSVTVLDYGATIQSFCIPGPRASQTDIVLGYDTLREYAENGGYLGATIGRDIQSSHPQLACGRGYDHNFILSGAKAAVRLHRETRYRVKTL